MNTFNNVQSLIQSISLLGSTLFAFLAWYQSRKNQTRLEQTHLLVNSQSEKLQKALEVQAYAKGAQDQRTSQEPGVTNVEELNT